MYQSQVAGFIGVKVPKRLRDFLKLPLVSVYEATGIIIISKSIYSKPSVKREPISNICDSPVIKRQARSEEIYSNKKRWNMPRLEPGDMKNSLASLVDMGLPP